jgi:hypothetical protein
MARRLGRAVFLGLLLWLTASVGGSLAATTEATTDTATGAQATETGESGREILVLLRAPPPHFRPNAAYGDAYDDTLGRTARHRIAARLARAHGLTLVTDWPMPLLGLDCYVMAAPVGRSPVDEAALLARDRGVAWSEPMHVYRGESAAALHPHSSADPPDDPLFRVEPATSQWRLADLHQMSTGRDVMVAVVDSQVERGHPDLIGQVQIAESFVAGAPVAAEDHGTGVAGIIAARARRPPDGVARLLADGADSNVHALRYALPGQGPPLRHRPPSPGDQPEPRRASRHLARPLDRRRPSARRRRGGRL